MELFLDYNVKDDHACAVSSCSLPKFSIAGLFESVHFFIHMLKKVLIFKSFVVRCIRSLCRDEREAFRYWCIGFIPKAKLDVDLSDGDMFQLVEFLCNDCKLSFTDLLLLKGFLSSVSRYDMLKELERVELGLYVGCIMEDYIKAVYCVGGADMRLISRYKNIVEFLVATSEENQELISSSILREVHDKDILKNLDGAILDLQLSWSTVISTLVIMGSIMGELYASFTPEDSVENGYCVNMFSETRTSERLTQWLIDNGGLRPACILQGSNVVEKDTQKAFDEYITTKQVAGRNGSGLSFSEESFKENIKLIGNRVDMK